MVADVSANIPKELLNIAYTLGASRWQVFRRVLLPASWPGVIDNMRIGLGWAWTYLIVAELVAASTGIGHVILTVEPLPRDGEDHRRDHHDRRPRPAVRRGLPLLYRVLFPYAERVGPMSSIAARGVSMVFETRERRGAGARRRDGRDRRTAHFACIVGASGCGKSTLLNIMAGLDAARPRARSRSASGQWRVPAPTAAWCSRATRSSRGCACARTSSSGRRSRASPTAERRRIADRLLEEMGLAEFARAYPRELSGGMKQRVAIARALANDPDVLLMDEPFGALDALTRAGAQRFLTEIWEQHRRTIAFVTHDIDEAIYLGDTVYVMSPRPGRSGRSCRSTSHARARSTTSAPRVSPSSSTTSSRSSSRT